MKTMALRIDEKGEVSGEMAQTMDGGSGSLNSGPACKPQTQAALVKCTKFQGSEIHGGAESEIRFRLNDIAHGSKSLWKNKGVGSHLRPNKLIPSQRQASIKGGEGQQGTFVGNAANDERGVIFRWLSSVKRMVQRRQNPCFRSNQERMPQERDDTHQKCRQQEVGTARQATTGEGKVSGEQHRKKWLTNANTKRIDGSVARQKK